MNDIFKAFTEKVGEYPVHQVLIAEPIGESPIDPMGPGCVGVCVRYLGQGMTPILRSDFVGITKALGIEP